MGQDLLSTLSDESTASPVQITTRAELPLSETRAEGIKPTLDCCVVGSPRSQHVCLPVFTAAMSLKPLPFHRHLRGPGDGLSEEIA